jgi:integrase/recombinase XerD
MTSTKLGSGRRCLRLDEWPPADREAWEAAHRRGGLLDDDGLAVEWAPPTNMSIAGAYGRFLWFLSEREDFVWDENPATRITRTRVEAYVAALRPRNRSSTVAAYLLQLLRAAAVMAPDTDWGWLRHICAGLRRIATPSRDDRARLVSAGSLIELANELMQRGEGSNGTTRQRALWFRDGLLIAVLCVCAPRARNLAGTMIGINLQRRGDEWWVCYQHTETKNHHPFEAPLPSVLNHPIDRYLTHHRPRLAVRSAVPGGGEALWLSFRGRPLTPKQIGQLVSAITRRELGQAMNPHLFRKVIPTELAIRDPEHVGAAQALLGHTDYSTTQQFYNVARALDAARLYQRMLSSLRDVRRDSR